MSFPKYEKYKDSGVEWLGKVPEHWCLAAVGYRYQVMLGKMLDERKITGNHLAPYLRNVDVQWDRINVENLPQMDFSGGDIQRYILQKGDLLVCEGGEVGRAAIWRGELVECFYQKALHRLRQNDMEKDHPRYMFYLLRMAVNQGVFDANGGKSTIAHLTAEALRQYRFCFPPKDEQQAICVFLDQETTKLDALIAEQRTLIDLLKEKRQAVISHGVTKGLNPQVPMKDSGVEWLGEVPAHWRPMPIRLAARLESGHTPSRSRPDWWENCTVPWFTLADVWQIREGGADYVLETKEKISELGLQNSSARLLPKGTVILSRTASVGFSAIMDVDMATTQDFANWVCGKDLLPEFLLMVFRSMKPEFERLMMGSTHNTIYMPDIQSFRFALPPLEEQKSIVAHVREAAIRFDELIAESELAISLLQERRTALISAAVTGKIDVRGLVEAAAPADVQNEAAALA